MLFLNTTDNPSLDVVLVRQRDGAGRLELGLDRLLVRHVDLLPLCAIDMALWMIFVILFFAPLFRPVHCILERRGRRERDEQRVVRGQRIHRPAAPRHRAEALAAADVERADQLPRRRHYAQRFEAERRCKQQEQRSLCKPQEQRSLCKIPEGRGEGRAARVENEHRLQVLAAAQLLRPDLELAGGQAAVAGLRRRMPDSRRLLP